jgi:hypothetical protein
MTQLVVLGISSLSIVLSFWVSRRMRSHHARVKSLDKRVQKLQNQVDALVERNFFLALNAREETSREEAPVSSKQPPESASAAVDLLKSPAAAPP